MRNLSFAIIFALLLCLVACHSMPSTSQPSDMPTYTTALPSSTSTTAASTTATTASSTTATTTTSIQVSFIDGSNGYPIMFVDSTNYRDRAYLLGAVVDGTFYPANCFAYNDASLLPEYSSSEKQPVESSILDLDKKLTFYSSAGLSYQFSSREITVTGVGRDMGEPEVLVTLDKTLDSGTSWLLGSYEGVPIIPSDIEAENCARYTDVNRNGILDCVKWEFKKDSLFGSDFLYDFDMWVERDGITYQIPAGDSVAVRQEELAVFIADIDRDGESEVGVYVRWGAKWSAITFYRFDGREYARYFGFSIDIAP